MLKPVLSNTLAQLVAKFVGAGLTFVTTAIIIRLSGPSLFGDLTKALVLISVGFTAIDFGLNAIAVRLLHGASRPQGVMQSVISARLLLSVLAVVATNLLVRLLPGGYTPEIKSIFWLGSLAIIFQGIFTSMNAWFQYREQYWYSSAASIAGTLLSAGLTYYYALTTPTLAHFLLAVTLGYMLMAVVASFLGKEVFSLTISPQPIARLLKGSALLGAILLASVVASKIDTIILGIFRASAEVGEYGFAYRIFDVLLVLPVFIMNALYPRLVKSTPESGIGIIRRAFPVLGVLGLILTLCTWVLSPYLLWIRPGLTLAVTTLRILSLSIPLFFLTAPLMWHLISRRQEKTVLKIYLTAATINTALNLLSIPHFGAPAAALVTGATELVILNCLVYFCRTTIFATKKV